MAGLKARAQAIRLPLAELARLAGVDPHTVLAIDDHARPRGPVRATIERVTYALTLEERRILGHLLALHPDQGRAA